MNSRYDVAIVGGGPVGASLALALRESRLKVCVIEARPADSTSKDARALALSYGSRLLLNRLGIWDRLDDVSSICSIHISQKQSFGRAVMRAEEMNVPELGYVLPYPSLHDALTDAIRHSDLSTIYGASVTQLSHADTHAEIIYQQGGEEHQINARLAVIADGGKLLAQQYPPTVHDYGQSALITHITCSLPQADTAFERFTPQGPLALLPFKTGYELVWTAQNKIAQDMLTWEDEKFLRELQQHFGDRVGTFLTVGKRTTFPLILKRAPNQTPMPHTVLLGNAAQTLHPVAGQGFNLGLRDAWELAQAILDSSTESLGSETMLAVYRSHRRTDREAGIRFTDSLVKLFSNNLPMVSTGRAAALTVLDCLPFAKKFVAKRMMYGPNG